MSAAIGVDVGGSKIAAGIVQADGTLSDRDEELSPAQQPELIVDAVAALVRRLDPSNALPVGLAVAGYLDRERTLVRFAPNLAWRDFPLRDLVRRASGSRVTLENDADAAAFGEYRHGGGQDTDDLLMVTLGTGVGGGVVQHGRLLRGAHGVGAELGHSRVERDGRRCGCGLRGCLEAYASGTALLSSGRQLLSDGGAAAAQLAQRCADPQRLTTRDVVAVAAAGDPACAGLVADVGRYLGEALGSLAAVLDPELILVGGGLGTLPEVLDPVLPTLADHLTGARFRPLPRVQPARLGNDAGIIGAAAIAMEEYQ